MWPTAKAALSHRADHSRQSATAVWPHSIFSSALTIVFDVAHTYARFCQEFFFVLFNSLSSHETKAVISFILFFFFFCHKVSYQLLTFWLVCLLSNSCSSWLVLKRAARRYLCMCECLCAAAWLRLGKRTRVYASVVVVVVGMSCEVSCVIFCLVVGYGGMLNALAARADAILCSVVFQPPLPCLALCGDWSHVLTSEFGSSSASPSFSLRGLQVFFVFCLFVFHRGKEEKCGVSFKQIWMLSCWGNPLNKKKTENNSLLLV